jgi:hypothetical protein
MILMNKKTDYRMATKTFLKTGTVFIYVIFTAGLLYSAPQEAPVFVSMFPADGLTVEDLRSSPDPMVSHQSDSSKPKPVLLSWKVSPVSSTLYYDVFLSKNDTPGVVDTVASNLHLDSFKIWNLEIASTWFWKISVKDSSGIKAESPVYSFKTPDLWPRMIFIDGVTNVRDIGGCTNRYSQSVRQGLYYRSSEFSPHHAISEYGIKQLLDLNIVFEIDLRNDDESPVSVLPPSVRYFRPLDPVGGVEAYWYGLQKYSNQYADVFHELAKPENYPLICHCWAGADRAGTVAALIEAILGYSEQQMELDYQWTSLSVYGVRSIVDSDWQGMETGLKSLAGPDQSFESGAINYLLSVGVTMEEISSIRKIFLEGESIAPQVRYEKNKTANAGKKQILKYACTDRYGKLPHFDAAQQRIFRLNGREIKGYNGTGRDNTRMNRTGVVILVINNQSN